MITPFLITGCGRSGTGWAAALFTALGYPTVHEEQFAWNKAGPLLKPEASWLAVPHIENLPSETRILRIMRDPYAVVRSAVARGFLRNGADAYDQYVAMHRPDIISADDHLGRVIRWVALWDEPIEGRNILRVDSNTHRTTGAARYATQVPLSRSRVGDVRRLLGTSINTTDEDLRWVDTPTIDQIRNHPDGALIEARAERFGYREWEER